jgi:hypothetical protein
VTRVNPVLETRPGLFFSILFNKNWVDSAVEPVDQVEKKNKKNGIPD